MNLHWTLALVIEHMRRLATNEPERIGSTVDGCSYLVRGEFPLKPVCIVGQFFADFGLLGLLVTNWREDGIHGEDGPCETYTSMWDRVRAAGIVVDENAIEFMVTLQQFQDGRHKSMDVVEPMPWGRAFASAYSETVKEERERIEEEVNDLRTRLTAESPLMDGLANGADKETSDILGLLDTNPWDTHHDSDMPPF